MSKPRFDYGFQNSATCDNQVWDVRVDKNPPHDRPILRAYNLCAVLQPGQSEAGNVELLATEIGPNRVEILGLDPEPGGDTFTLCDDLAQYARFEDDNETFAFKPEVIVQAILDYEQVKFMVEFYGRVLARMEACRREEAKLKEQPASGADEADEQAQLEMQRDWESR